ncbi:DUF4291 domain-containing protein [Streptomyces orinoci]|uniref:DUF4291 domain-containing protein n=1 Tax=Streptomyces orinoci TaxID=67339 RepID=A0ABV3JVC7_STRON|nr:DUF4291 domain-containing protein [Streptomyces orinoci]
MLAHDKATARKCLVRAVYGDSAITVYQAYPKAIAERAVRAGTFVAPFKRERMTWIKPSFLWMMYRSGWASKPGQERVLAIEITREGFEWALGHAALSHFDHTLHPNERTWRSELRESPVRIQWDPERSITLEPLTARAIQVGLSGEAVDRYVDDWVTGITDITDFVHEVHSDVTKGRTAEAVSKLPAERYYPLPEEIRQRVRADG